MKYIFYQAVDLVRVEAATSKRASSHSLRGDFHVEVEEE